MPTKVKVFNENGEKVAEWSVPTTALACVLCEYGSTLYLVSNKRCTFTILGVVGKKEVITYDTKTPFIWLAHFEPIVSVQIVLQAYDGYDYGWRPLRNWRRMAEDITETGWRRNNKDAVDSAFACGGARMYPSA